MPTLPQDRLSALQAKIAELRETVDALKRDGHVHDDAERQLENLLGRMEAYKKPPRRS